MKVNNLIYYYKKLHRLHNIRIKGVCFVLYAGYALPVAIVAKCEEKVFLAQKNSIWRKQMVKKKIVLPKNRHLNIAFYAT